VRGSSVAVMETSRRIALASASVARLVAWRSVLPYSSSIGSWMRVDSRPGATLRWMTFLAGSPPVARLIASS